jgi:hypothetical protein
VRIWELDTPVKVMTDPYSNVGLIDMTLFRRAYP